MDATEYTGSSSVYHTVHHTLATGSNKKVMTTKPWLQVVGQSLLGHRDLLREKNDVRPRVVVIIYPQRNWYRHLVHVTWRMSDILPKYSRLVPMQLTPLSMASAESIDGNGFEMHCEIGAVPLLPLHTTLCQVVCHRTKHPTNQPIHTAASDETTHPSIDTHT